MATIIDNVCLRLIKIFFLRLLSYLIQLTKLNQEKHIHFKILPDSELSFSPTEQGELSSPNYV